MGWFYGRAGGPASSGMGSERIRRETDPSDLMEGLYLKVEAEGGVRARYKYVRADFLTDFDILG